MIEKGCFTCEDNGVSHCHGCYQKSNWQPSELYTAYLAQKERVDDLAGVISNMDIAYQQVVEKNGKLQEALIRKEYRGVIKE